MLTPEVPSAPEQKVPQEVVVADAGEGANAKLNETPPSANTTHTSDRNQRLRLMMPPLNCLDTMRSVLTLT